MPRAVTPHRVLPPRRAPRAGVTAEALFKWVSGKRKASEDAGQGTAYPTLAEAARRFRCPIDDIETAIEDGQGSVPGYFGIAVAIGNGHGYYPLPRGQWLIEAYE
jgi:hypothetical protein